MDYNYQRKAIKHGIVSATPLPNNLELKEYYQNKYYQNADGSTTYENIYSEEEIQHKILEADISILAIKEHLKNPKKNNISFRVWLWRRIFSKPSRKRMEYSWN